MLQQQFLKDVSAYWWSDQKTKYIIKIAFSIKRRGCVKSESILFISWCIGLKCGIINNNKIVEMLKGCGHVNVNGNLIIINRLLIKARMKNE